MQAFDKLTHVVDGERRIISDPPLIQPVEEIFEGVDAERFMDWMRTLLRDYGSTLQSDRRHLLEDFRLAHVARKVVGVGSVGTRAWILLMFGRDDADPLFLQAKEAQASVLEEFVGSAAYASMGHASWRASTSCRRPATSSSGTSAPSAWMVSSATSTCVNSATGRALPIVETMTPSALAAYGRVCGWTLARAHARSGDRIAIASYLGSGDAFDRAIAEFSEAYADQNERDYGALVQAEKDGRITVERGQ